MKKFAALALVATALSALPGAAQSQTAKPAPAAQNPPIQIDDLGCVVRLSNVRNLLLKRASDPASTAEVKAKSTASAFATDRALAYYLGRLSMAANDPYRGKRGEAIFNAMKSASRDRQAAENLACFNNGEQQIKAMSDTLKP